MPQDAQSSTFSAQLVARAAERLLAPQDLPPFTPRLRFGACLALCLLIHAALVACPLREDALDLERTPQNQEIPVEIVVAPPPELKQEPPKPKETPPKQVEKQEMLRREKPAFDAPRAESREKSEPEADDEMRAQRVAPPPEDAAPNPEPREAPKEARDEATRSEVNSAPQKPVEEKPEAEIIERAKPTPTLDDKQVSKETRPAPKIGKAKSAPEQVAALAPSPEMQLGGAAKPSPVGGGHAKTTYLSILYGLIIPKMHVPPSANRRPATGRGSVVFYVDEAGKLIYQQLKESSGVPELDAAALNAVRTAAPFPPVPFGHSHVLVFSFGAR